MIHAGLSLACPRKRYTSILDVERARRGEPPLTRLKQRRGHRRALRLVRKPPGGGWRERALEQTATPRKPARARARQPNRAGFSPKPLRLPRETRSLHARCGYFGKLPAAHAYDAQHRQMRDAYRRRTTPTTNAKCHPHSNKPQTRTCACHHPILPQKATGDLDATSSIGSPTGRQPEKALTTLRNRTDAARCTTRHDGRHDARRDGKRRTVRTWHPGRSPRPPVYKIDDKL